MVGISLLKDNHKLCMTQNAVVKHLQNSETCMYEKTLPENKHHEWLFLRKYSNHHNNSPVGFSFNTDRPLSAVKSNKKQSEQLKKTVSEIQI